jgi:hypothetical protein
MPETIRMSMSVQVDGGPSLAASPSILVDIYDKISIVVPPEDAPATGVTVKLQPDVTANVDVVAITSSHYAATNLTYDLGGEIDIALDGPQLFAGAGMLGLFSAALEDMTIKNSIDTDVTVSVLVGRTAS